MKIDDLEIRIATNILVEEVEGEVLILNKDTEQIISMNSIASLVWKKVCEVNTEGKNITTSDMASYILSKCNLTRSKKFEVQRDVNDCFQQFQLAGLLNL